MSTKQIVGIFVLICCALVGLILIGKYTSAAPQSSQSQKTVIQQLQGAPGPMGSTKWEVAPKSTTKRAEESITSQLKAFGSDNYALAATYQSTELQHHFQTTDAFRAMMKADYPEFASYKSVKFGPAEATNDQKLVVIPVKLVGKDGIEIGAVYELILEENSYRISGVAGGMTMPKISAPVSNPQIS